MTRDSAITELLGAVRRGEQDAWDRLADQLYDQLRVVARGQLRRGAAGETLTPTVVVHEAYLKLVRHQDADYRDRQHFFAVAATAMRQVVVDHARRRVAQKRGGGAHHTVVDGSHLGVSAGTVDVLAVDEAIDRLEHLDERLARTVVLRFFGGLTVDETAEVLGVSSRTVKGDWRKARALLQGFLAP